MTIQTLSLPARAAASHTSAQERTPVNKITEAVLRSDIYQSPFTVRYGSLLMRNIFSADHRGQAFRKVWIALAETEKKLGLTITQEQIDELKAHVDTINLARVEEIEKVMQHDVMAHLEAFAEDCPLAKPIIHLGATSCNITDNADMMIIYEAFDVIQGKLIKLIEIMADNSEEFKDMACLSFTHLQAAQPTTVGKRMALWLQPFLCTADKISDFQSSLKLLGLKGATGTQNSFLELFDNDFEKVEQLDPEFVRALGFKNFWALSGQTYPRIQDSEVLDILDELHVNSKKMATDIRLLASKYEMEESFKPGQKGSSAMPYKRNPIKLENVCSLARLSLTHSSVAKQTAAEQWMERSLDDSAGRRITIAESFLAADSILDTLTLIMKNVVIRPKMIQQNLMRELPFMATENIMMALVKKGGDRQVLHEILLKHSQAVGDLVKEGGPNDLIQRLAADERIDFTEEELNEIMDPQKFTGMASRQVSNYLRDEVKPFMARHQK